MNNINEEKDPSHIGSFFMHVSDVQHAPLKSVKYLPKYRLHQ